jgi:hypothetical protein
MIGTHPYTPSSFWATGQGVSMGNSHISDVDKLICAALRGEGPVWPASFGELDDVFVSRSEYHGVTALLNEQKRLLKEWPPAVRDWIRRHSIAQAFWEIRQKQIMTEVFAALSKKGVEALLFKGAALAYGLYSNPFWRARPTPI